MGAVWRARDTRLGRAVAVKILPEEFTGDEERLRRFEREARLLAALNHPHVAQIYGVDQVGETCFIVMELVGGETLGDRIARGGLTLEEALDACRQVAEGLEAAHEAGIVHRDLKPANVCLTEEGVVKVLDFGLAKGGGEKGDSGPTMILQGDSFSLTEEGKVMGTPTYMSPEQARGRKTDRRTDVWSFGCLLYECLSGRKAFGGETVTDLLGAIVHKEPDWEQLPAATPPRVRELLRRCLVKDPKLRLRDIGEARVALAEAIAAPSSSVMLASGLFPREAGDASAGAERRGPWPVIVAALVALAAGVLVGRALLAPAADGAEGAAGAAHGPSKASFEVRVPGRTLEYGSLALSPDATQLAFLVRDEDGRGQLWLRPLASFEARPLPGTTGARYPFWSPDGRELAFFAGDQLLRMPVDGTAPRVVSGAKGAVGGTWSADGVILFGTEEGPIHRVSASGGAPPTAITTLDLPVETSHFYPAFLPDGRRFLFLADASSEAGHRLRLGSLDGGETRSLRTGLYSNIALDPRGAVLLAEKSQLVAQPFDVGRGELAGDLVLVADGVWSAGQHHEHPFATSASAGLAYQLGSTDAELVRIDLATAGQEPFAGGLECFEPSLSPDGRLLAFHGGDQADDRLIWVQDVARGTRTLISDRGKLADSPTWTPDGRMLYFDMNVDGRWHAYRRPADGGRPAERLPMPPGCDDMWTLDVSRDGAQLLISSRGPESDWGLYLLPLEALGDEPWTDDPPAERASAVTAAWRRWPANERIEIGRLSPDGRWIAYAGSASGQAEIYVASVAGGPAEGRLQVSVDGGSEVAWAPDGSRLYYRSRTDEIMEVPIRLDGSRPQAEAPRAVLELNLPAPGNQRNTFEVLADGQSMIATRIREGADRAIRVQLGWHW